MRNSFLLGISFVMYAGLSFFGNTANVAAAETVQIDGSSTVFPISEAVAEEFGKVNPRIRVTVGLSGTGGGFKKFVLGETDINDASRPVKDKELKKMKPKGIEFVELPVAYDGLSVLVNPKNTWVDYLTTKELHKIWEPGSKVKKWSDIRAGFPNKPITLYGPGTDSGTFDYFTETINGKAQSCRSDYTASADPNVLVQGIAGDASALGFFGFAYYVENTDKLRLIPVKYGNNKPVTPSMVTINNGTYKPLSRPIFIYVNTKSAKRPAVAKFVNYYLAHAPELVKDVGYVPLPTEVYELGKKRFAERVTGSLFSKVEIGESLKSLKEIMSGK